MNTVLHNHVSVSPITGYVTFPEASPHGLVRDNRGLVGKVRVQYSRYV